MFPRNVGNQLQDYNDTTQKATAVKTSNLERNHVELEGKFVEMQL
jgi:hypothetical protein